MLLKRLIIFSVIPLMVLMGCGQHDRELVVGHYTDEKTIVYSEDALKDEEKIEDFKNIIDSSTRTDERPKGLPQYVVTINNLNDSTMELMINFWINEENGFIFTKGLEGNEHFEVNEDDINDVKELIN
ncbi:hypothetical protein [Exiguobacterium sp. KJ 601]|uniref:hypothetical protein n=1 Tax=Exiguobacterium sp. KJ 601 TaxID=2782569 RepID=UPI0022AFB39A|nr:hypothetical protein [Exiguobacterium sp. KJ 601]